MNLTFQPPFFRINLVVYILFLLFAFCDSSEKLIHIYEGASWDFTGMRITADLAETTHYNYNETVIGKKKFNGKEYFILRSQSDEENGEPSFTFIRESGDSFFTVLYLEGFGEFELLVLPSPVETGKIWNLVPDTTFTWQENGLIYNLKLCGIGIMRGKEKIKTKFGKKEAFVIDNLHSQELILTNTNADTILWDNKEELQRFYIVPGVGVVVNIEIDAIGNKRIEFLNKYNFLGENKKGQQ